MWLLMSASNTSSVSCISAHKYTQFQSKATVSQYSNVSQTKKQLSFICRSVPTSHEFVTAIPLLRSRDPSNQIHLSLKCFFSINIFMVSFDKTLVKVLLQAIVGKKWDHRILDPLFFSGKIRKNTKS